MPHQLASVCVCEKNIPSIFKKQEIELANIMCKLRVIPTIFSMYHVPCVWPAELYLVPWWFQRLATPWCCQKFGSGVAEERVELYLVPRQFFAANTLQCLGAVKNLVAELQKKGIVCDRTTATAIGLHTKRSFLSLPLV